jgi:hypothetical protein
MLPVVCILIGAGAAQIMNHERRRAELPAAYRAGASDAIETVAATTEGARRAQGHAVTLDPVEAIVAVTDQTEGLARVSRYAMQELDRRASALPMFSRIAGMGAALPPAVVRDAIRVESAPKFARIAADLRRQGVPERRIRALRAKFARADVDTRAQLAAAIDDGRVTGRRKRGVRERTNRELCRWILERIAILRTRALDLPPAKRARITGRLDAYAAKCDAAKWPADTSTIRAELLEIVERLRPPAARRAAARPGAPGSARRARRAARARRRMGEISPALFDRMRPPADDDPSLRQASFDAAQNRREYEYTQRMIAEQRADAVADFKRRRRRKRGKVARTLALAASNAIVPGPGAVALLAQAVKRRRKAKKRRLAARQAARQARAAVSGAAFGQARRKARRRRRALNQMRGLVMGPAFPVGYP